MRDTELGNTEKLPCFRSNGTHCRLRKPKTEKHTRETEIRANAENLPHARNALKRVCALSRLRLTTVLLSVKRVSISQMEKLRLPEVQ